MVVGALRNLAQNSPHDLPRTSLGEVWNDEDLLGGGNGSNLLPDLVAKGVDHLVMGEIDPLLQDAKGDDRLASEVIRPSHHGSLGAQVILDQGALDFGSSKPVSRHVDDIWGGKERR